MQDITPCPVSRVDVAAAAVTIAGIGFSTSPDVTAPEQYAPDLPRPVTQRGHIPTIETQSEGVVYEFCFERLGENTDLAG